MYFTAAMSIQPKGIILQEIKLNVKIIRGAATKIRLLE
jgi:hypothetical protein